MDAPVAPAPVTIFTTPGGRSASLKISASFNAVSGSGFSRFQGQQYCHRQVQVQSSMLPLISENSME